jgi:hypothetical protein
MSVTHRAGIGEKRKVGARFSDTSGAFLETMYDCPLILAQEFDRECQSLLATVFETLRRRRSYQ